jgi:hypothetical protein
MSDPEKERKSWFQDEIAPFDNRSPPLRAERAIVTRSENKKGKNASFATKSQQEETEKFLSRRAFSARNPKRSSLSMILSK